MNGAINIALSGMRAAALRVANSANNIANAQSAYTSTSEGKLVEKVFVPKEVVQIADPNGGTIATTRDSGRAPIKYYDPQTGVVEAPNVDLASELAEVSYASSVYKANLKIATQSSVLYESLFKIDT